MDKIGEIKHIWRDRFNDSRQWMSEVFPLIYRDDEAMALTVDGSVVSELLLRRYRMRFREAVMPTGYICGAATARREQGKGYMTELMERALRQSRDRGDVAVVLQPARRRLYGYFARFGFSTVFFIDEQRYTSVHRFVNAEERYVVEDMIYDYAEVAAAYERLSARRESTVLHTEADFKNIALDNRLADGMVSVVRYADNGSICAVAFAVTVGGTIAVRDVVAADDDAEAAALQSFAKRRPGMMTVVEAYPGRPGVRVHARGMARIVNVERLFALLASLAPDVRQTIRVNDPAIAENCGTFRLSGGKVRRIDDAEERRIDLDVDINVLASIVFSESSVGDIFNLPTARPFISLMLS